MNQFDVAYNTDVASFGLGGLRDKASGTINVTGLSGTVTQAYLIWNGPTDVWSDSLPVNFAGTEILGDRVAMGTTNCWNYYAGQTFVADVTSKVAGNGAYSFSGLYQAAPRVNVNGVSLVITYRDSDSSNNKDVYLYVGADASDGGWVGNLYEDGGWATSLDGFGYGGGSAKLELHVSDGQANTTGGAYEGRLSVNGTELAPVGQTFSGDTVPGQLNGGVLGGGDTGNLWDIKSFNITSTLSSGPASLDLAMGNGDDCTTLVAALLITDTSGLSLSPWSSTQSSFTDATMDAKYVNPQTGQARSNVPLVFSVTEGPNQGNPGEGCYEEAFGVFLVQECVTGALGRIRWVLDPVHRAGTDQIEVYADKDGDGKHDPLEPVTRASMSWYQPLRVAALGDSFSSGEGVRPYQAGTDLPTNRCRRSELAYSGHMTIPGTISPLRADPDPSAWRLAACSGARTYNVYTTPPSTIEPARSQFGEPFQLNNSAVLDQAQPANALTMSIGGNDAGFADIVAFCARTACTAPEATPHPDVLPADMTYTQYVQSEILNTRDNLDQVYDELWQRGYDEKPAFILGYPQLFPASGAICPTLLPWAFAGETDFFRDMTSLMNDIIQQEAYYYGLQFVDVEVPFEGHEVCGENGEWVSGIVLSDPGPGAPFPSQSSFHPNLQGQYEYGKALNAFITRTLAAGQLQMPNGLPANPIYSDIYPDGVSIGPAAAVAAAAVRSSAELNPAVNFKAVDLTMTPTVAHSATACSSQLATSETVSVQADGFEPNSPVNLLLMKDGAQSWDDATTLKSVSASATGTIQTNVTMPSTLTPAEIKAALHASGRGPNGQYRLASGYFTFVKTLKDCAGTSPNVTVTSPTAGQVVQVGAPLTLNYTCQATNAGATITYCGGDLPTASQLPTDSPGTYSVRLSAEDSKGFVSQRTVQYQVADYRMGDTSNVQVSIADGAAFNLGENVSVTYSCTPPSGKTITSCTGTQAPGTTISTSTAGEFDFIVRAVDSAGAPTVKVAHYSVAAQPVISSLSLAQGTSLGGSSVRVVGTGFTSGSVVRFGAVNAAQTTRISSNELVAITPPGSGVVDATVVTAAGQSAAGTKFTYGGAGVSSFMYAGGIVKGLVNDTSGKLNDGTISTAFSGSVTSTVATGSTDKYLNFPSAACLAPPSNSSCKQAGVLPKSNTQLNAANGGAAPFAFGAEIRVPAGLTGTEPLTVMQRGDLGTGQNQWRLQIRWDATRSYRVASCRFSDGSKVVVVTGTQQITGGDWFQLSCLRSENTVSVTTDRTFGTLPTETIFDGQILTAIAPTVAAIIATTKVYTAKGKSDVDSMQFHGHLDDLFFVRG